MGNVSDKNFGENQTHILFLITFLILFVYEIWGKKYSRARQATDDNMAHAFCMLGT
jgi:hypothetical protein